MRVTLKSCEKSEEQQHGTGMSVQLGKLYGVVAKVQIPPNTKLTVKIKTYSFEIGVSAPRFARLLVYLECVPHMLLWLKIGQDQ